MSFAYTKRTLVEDFCHFLWFSNKIEVQAGCRFSDVKVQANKTQRKHQFLSTHYTNEKVLLYSLHPLGFDD